MELQGWQGAPPVDTQAVSQPDPPPALPSTSLTRHQPHPPPASPYTSLTNRLANSRNGSYTTPESAAQLSVPQPRAPQPSARCGHDNSAAALPRQVLGYDRSDGRYTVQMSEAQQLRVKLENLLL